MYAVVSFMLFAAFVNCTQYYGDCSEVAVPPCSIGNNRYHIIKQLHDSSESKLYLVSYSNKSEVQEHFAIKFTTIIAMNHYVDEIMITRKMYDIAPKNSIKLVDADRFYIHSADEVAPKLRSVLVLQYHPLGDLSTLTRFEHVIRKLAPNRDRIVIKFLKDVGYVLKQLWVNGYIHRDVKLGNVLVDVDPDFMNEPEFIVIDYGRVLIKESAEEEVISPRGREKGFCQKSSHVEYQCFLFLFSNHEWLKEVLLCATCVLRVMYMY